MGLCPPKQSVLLNMHEDDETPRSLFSPRRLPPLNRRREPRRARCRLVALKISTPLITPLNCIPGGSFLNVSAALISPSLSLSSTQLQAVNYELLVEDFKGASNNPTS